MASQSRRQRRAYELWLKKVDPAQYREWKKDSLMRGKATHEENEEQVRKAEEAFYEALQTKMIESLRVEGRSNEEIDSFIEDWAQTIKVWGSHEKPLRMHDIKKAKSLASND